MQKYKIVITTMFVFAALVNLCGCFPDDHQPGNNETGTPEIVGAVPDELFHWFSHEMAQDRGARVFSNSHEGYTYYVATAGKQSVVGGEIDIVEKELESEHWSYKLEYYYPGLTERSLERHFLIIKVPENTSIGVSIAAVTGVEQQD